MIPCNIPSYTHMGYRPKLGYCCFWVPWVLKRINKPNNTKAPCSRLLVGNKLGYLGADTDAGLPVVGAETSTVALF